MKPFKTLLLGLAISAFAVTGASAAVVCNEDGDCWRVEKRYEYPAEANVTIHEDDWEWDEAEADNYRWREAGEGRGYWRGGVWVDF